MQFDNPIAVGNTAEIFLQNGRVVKLFKCHLPETEAEFEAAKQRHACKLGIKVPHIFDVTKINGRPAIVMEYIPGRTLMSMILDEPSKVEHYLNICVEEQLKLHAIPYCHGDFHAGNLILGQDGVTIIDWVDANDGEVQADVHRTYSLYAKHSPELAELYLRAYRNKEKDQL